MASPLLRTSVAVALRLLGGQEPHRPVAARPPPGGSREEGPWAVIGFPVFLNPFRGSTAGAPIAEAFCGSIQRTSCSALGAAA
jgi:hypothetical protein